MLRWGSVSIEPPETVAVYGSVGLRFELFTWYLVSALPVKSYAASLWARCIIDTLIIAQKRRLVGSTESCTVKGWCP